MTRYPRALLPLALLGVLAGCGDSPETLFDKARGDFAAEDYQGARQHLAAALQERPEDRAMLALMAQTQLRLGDPDGAEGAIKRLAQAGVHGAEVARMKAQLALLRKAPDQALTLLGGDASVDGWRIRAEAQLALGQDAQAARSFERGMAAGNDIRLADAYARYRLGAEDLRGAEAIFGRMRAIAPGSYETLLLEGDLSVAQGQADQAITAYRKAAKAYPDRIAPLLALANLFDAKSNLAEATKLVYKAAEIAPEDAAVEALSFQLMSEKGEWEKIRLALQGRESELEAGSGLSMTYAEALLRLGHAEQARVLFARAVLVLPGNPYSRMMLGEAQLATGDAQGAWDTLRPLAASTLARPEILQNAEKAARAAGDPEADVLRARLDPRSLKPTMALVGQGEGALVRQDWTTAATAYRQLLLRGEDPEVLKRLALVSSRLGQPAEAIGYAGRALALAPDNPDYLYIAGLVRLEAGQDLPGARRLLEAAAAGDPRNPVIARDLRKAKAATG